MSLETRASISALAEPSVPVESNPVSFKSGCELRSCLLQRLHEVLLAERSDLGGALPGADGLLKRHETDDVSLLQKTQRTPFVWRNVLMRAGSKVYPVKMMI